MRKIAAAALLLAIPAIAAAASPEDPVRRMMDVATARLDEQSSGGDYFDTPRLGRDYSGRFVEAYTAASKYPAYDDGSSNPFGYDVIANGQDGCPLEDVTYREGQSDGAKKTVVVRFKLWQCIPKDEQGYDSISEVRFDVVTENGQPVIDDIHRMRDGKWDSLVAEMAEIVKFGEQNASTPQ
ncbi:hypothetical protein JJB09_05045 [Rhizobium sp. KVB221]|uniref:DUF3828 domain-containing protein n=1 Tax=Rhizobium setariae TaxID=2801340 RepID=A0A936YMD1_9HYPH|nr:hypothetical protein [Rhizobium setariae]MBL0371387.1 hypothetical protein [Rhizobium setariae]